ncbi:hypothetical protein [Thermogemmatispora sp.]|uniref:hypothetical protein n=1 Tax=Thermogemmatispora sp. TaxID=1968838 RepID=UPI0035E42496
MYGKLHLRRQREQIIPRLVMSALTLALLAACWLLGHSHALPSTTARRLESAILPGGLTGLWLLCLGWQLLQAPTALWDLPDQEWWLTAPVSMVLVLMRVSLRLLATLGSIGVILLALGAVALAALQLSLPLALALGLLLLYGAFCSTLVALLLTLWLARYFGKRHLRRLIIVVAVGFCCLPLGLVLLSRFPEIGEHMGLQQLSGSILWPGTVLTALILTPAGGGTGPSLAPLSPGTSLLVLAAMFAGLLLLGGMCVWIGRRGYLAGWEGVLAAPGRQARDRSVDRATLRGGSLWESAQRLHLGPPAVSALIGFCWQDALYDWRRLSSIVISALLLLAAGWHATLSGPLALPLVLALTLSLDALIARMLGLPALRRLLEARSLLQMTPTTAGTLLWSCLLATGLPLLLINNFLFILTLVLMPLTSRLAALFYLCLLGCGLGFSLLSVSAGCPTARPLSVQGSLRVSAGIFLLGGLGLALSSLLPLSAATLLDLDPAKRYLILRLLQAMTHLSLSPQLRMWFFWGLPAATLIFLIALTLQSARVLSKVLSPLPRGSGPFR